MTVTGVGELKPSRLIREPVTVTTSLTPSASLPDSVPCATACVVKAPVKSANVAAVKQVLDFAIDLIGSIVSFPLPNLVAFFVV